MFIFSELICLLRMTKFYDFEETQKLYVGFIVIVGSFNVYAFSLLLKILLHFLNRVYVL